MWALTYDYMVSYSMKDMSPAAGAGHGVGHLRRRADLDLQHPRRREVVRRRAADRGRHRLHLQPDPRRRPRGSDLGRPTSTSVDQVDGSRRHTVVLTLKKPNAVLPLLPIPIVPEHIWKDVSEKDDQELRRRAAATASPWSAPGRSGWSRARPAARRTGSRPNPDYWGGAPHVDQVVFRVYKSEDPAVQALIKGEVDFVEDITPLQVKALAGRGRASPRTTATRRGFDEIAFNTGAVDLETGKPIGDANPALLDPKFRHALGFARRPRPDRRDGLPGRRHCRGPRSSRRRTPTGTGSRRTTQAFTFDLDKAGAAARRGRLHDGLRRQADHARRLPIGTLRLSARSEQQDVGRHHGVLPGVAGRARHRRRGQTYDGQQQADQRDPRRRASTPSSGAGTSSPTRTRSSAT